MTDGLFGGIVGPGDLRFRLKGTVILPMFTQTQKQVAQLFHGRASLAGWKKQALENFSQLFEEDRQGIRAREADHEKELNELFAEIGRLSAQLSWLKKTLASNLSMGERLVMLEKDRPELSLKVQAELLLANSSLCA